MSTGVRRRPEDLSPQELEQLRQAHTQLREAVAQAERFREAPLTSEASMAGAYAAVDEAEKELWQLRERLLGWARPAMSLAAREVLDWFSEEDEIYDSES